MQHTIADVFLMPLYLCKHDLYTLWLSYSLKLYTLASAQCESGQYGYRWRSFGANMPGLG